MFGMMLYNLASLCLKMALLPWALQCHSIKSRRKYGYKKWGAVPCLERSNKRKAGLMLIWTYFFIWYSLVWTVETKQTRQSIWVKTTEIWVGFGLILTLQWSPTSLPISCKEDKCQFTWIFLTPTVYVSADKSPEEIQVTIIIDIFSLHLGHLKFISLSSGKFVWEQQVAPGVKLHK